MNKTILCINFPPLLYIWSNFNIENGLIAQRSICAAVDDIKMVSNKPLTLWAVCYGMGRRSSF